MSFRSFTQRVDERLSLWALHGLAADA
jgi:hypothetical protein